MIRLIVLLLVCVSLILGGISSGYGGSVVNPVAVARSFLPPHSKLATLYTFDYRTMRYGPSFPAVLKAHVLGPDSEDIVFAYYSPRPNQFDKTLFVGVLHQVTSSYVQVYVLSFRDNVLMVSKAIRIVHLRGIPTEAIAVITGIGATLGGELRVFVWHNQGGLLNIIPSNGSVHYFYFFPRKDGLKIALSASRRPGLNVTPRPVWYRWNGKRFVKIAPPSGSSKWALPD